MPRQTWVMVEVTDQYGEVESEMCVVESWDGGQVVRLQLEGQSFVFADADRLRAALAPDVEERAA